MAKKRRFAAAALTAVLALCAGCSTAGSQMSRHNAVVYVQGVLDETYTGQPSDSYLTLVDHTAQDAQDAFQTNLESELSQRLCLRFDLEEQFMSRQLKADFLELLDQVYARANYTVKTATALDTGRYCVELTVTPVTFFAAAYADGFKSLQEEFEAHHTPPDQNSEDGVNDENTVEGEDPTPAQQRKERETYEALWAQTVYDYLYARLDAVTTGAAVTKLVLVSADGDGIYTLQTSDLQDVDDLILQY